jgi:hypothetical protein
LTFASGDVEGVVHVAIRGDGVVEPDEALSVGLSDPSNAKLGDASAPLTIEDGEPLALAVTSPSVTEGNRGTTPGTFTVALDGAAPAGSSMSVDYHVAGVTATVPGDVAPASGTLTFAAGVKLGRLSDRRAGRYTWLEQVRRRRASRLDGSRAAQPGHEAGRVRAAAKGGPCPRGHFSDADRRSRCRGASRRPSTS